MLVDLDATVSICSHTCAKLGSSMSIPSCSARSDPHFRPLTAPLSSGAPAREATRHLLVGQERNRQRNSRAAATPPTVAELRRRSAAQHRLSQPADQQASHDHGLAGFVPMFLDGRVAAATIRETLRQDRLPPAHTRSTDHTWRAFLRAHTKTSWLATFPTWIS